MLYSYYIRFKAIGGNATSGNAMKPKYCVC